MCHIVSGVQSIPWVCVSSLRAAVTLLLHLRWVCAAGVSCQLVCCLLAHCGGAMQPTSRCRCHSSRWLRCDQQLRMGWGFGVSREKGCIFRHRGSCWTDHGRVSVTLWLHLGGASVLKQTCVLVCLCRR